MIPLTHPTAVSQDSSFPFADRREALDPMRSEPRVLPRAGLEWLSDNGYLDPTDTSPLAYLRHEGGRASRTQRARAAASLFDRGELACRRRSSAERPESSRGSGLERALAILERPIARLRFGVAQPGQLPTVREFYLRGNELVHSFSDGDVAFVGDPVRLDHVLASLVRHLASPDLPAEMEMLCMMPRLFELTTALWKQRGKPLDAAITEAEVASLLLGSQTPTPESGRLLAGMADAGVLRRDGSADGGYLLSEPYRDWLALTWSEHVFEIERGELVAEGEARGSADRLLFVGPPARRVLCEDVVLEPEQRSCKPGSGHAVASGAVMLLSRLGGAELMNRLAALLRPGLTRGEAIRAAGAPRFPAATKTYVN